MKNFILSAFADEIDSDFENQLKALKKLDIGLIELRGVNGKSFAQLSDAEVAKVKQQLAEYEIGISALGSPIGKISVDGDFEAHKALFTRIMDIGDALGTKCIRVFSFYPAENMAFDAFEKKVFFMLDVLLTAAHSRGFTLCHENEKDIYGDSPEREYKLLSHFNGRLRAVLDPGNFAFCKIDGSNAYVLMKDYIDYLHIKDADKNGVIVPPGKGVAGIAEILIAIAADREFGQTILTMEPHLMEFAGLASLSKLDDIKHKYTFESPFKAFETAVNTVKGMIAALE